MRCDDGLECFACTAPSDLSMKQAIIAGVVLGQRKGPNAIRSLCSDCKKLLAAFAPALDQVIE